MDGARTALTHHSPTFYYDTLQSLASRIDLWETTYYHILAGPEVVLEWFRGTGLRPYLEALSSDDERRRFEVAQDNPHRRLGHAPFDCVRVHKAFAAIGRFGREPVGRQLSEKLGQNPHGVDHLPLADRRMDIDPRYGDDRLIGDQYRVVRA